MSLNDQARKHTSGTRVDTAERRAFLVVVRLQRPGDLCRETRSRWTDRAIVLGRCGAPGKRRSRGSFFLAALATSPVQPCPMEQTFGELGLALELNCVHLLACFEVEWQ